MSSIGSILHQMLVLMVEAMQLADDATYRAHGRRGASWKVRNVVARDRLRPSMVWASQGTGDI